MRRRHAANTHTASPQRMRCLLCLLSLRDVLRIVMGEWKAPLSLRVRQELRSGLEEAAARDKRTLGNLGEVLLEWSFQQLQVVGSTERLLKYRVRPPAERRRRPENS
jgi:hypothetical protein